jgi:hypothetical protein
VPRGGHTHASSPPGFNGLAGGGAIVVCTNHRARSGPITQGRCVSPSWIFEAGAPAGLPPDAPPNVRGKRVAYGRRTRPPHYVHIIIYASRRSLAPRFPFVWPRGTVHAVNDHLLRLDRTTPILFGQRTWAGRRGTLILAPPLAFGGENGDHLAFRWTQDGIDRVVSLHAWTPLREAIATLRAVVRSSD